MYALDANTVIRALKGEGNVVQRFRSTDRSQISIPAVVQYDLEFGSLNSHFTAQRQRDLRLLIASITVLPFDQDVSGASARIRYQLERSGTKVGILDTLIAGTVLAHGAVLVTHNTLEFSRIPGLQLEDWL